MLRRQSRLGGCQSISAPERSACRAAPPARRLSTVRDANTIAVVYKGRIVEQGSHDEVRRRILGPCFPSAGCVAGGCARD